MFTKERVKGMVIVLLCAVVAAGIAVAVVDPPEPWQRRIVGHFTALIVTLWGMHEIRPGKGEE